MILRVVQFSAEKGFKMRCLVCDGPTRENKPFCTEHILGAPYAYEVRSTLEAREAELLAPEKPTPLLEEDFMALLKSRGDKCNLGAFTREMNVSIEIAAHVAKRLEKRGEISIRVSKRKRWTITRVA